MNCLKEEDVDDSTTKARIGSGVWSRGWSQKAIVEAFTGMLDASDLLQVER